MDRIVNAFNALTKRNLTEAEGWMFMICLKLARTAGRPLHNPDDAVDIANYAALLEEHLDNVLALDNGHQHFPMVRVSRHRAGDCGNKDGD